MLVALLAALAAAALTASILLLPSGQGPGGGGSPGQVAGPPHTTLRGIDVGTNSVLPGFRGERSVFDIASGMGAVWALIPRGVLAYPRSSPTSGPSKARANLIPLSATPRDLDIGHRAVWVVTGTGPHGNKLVKINALRQEVAWQLPIGFPAAHVVVSQRLIWVLSETGGVLLGIDPDRKAIVHRVFMSSGAVDMAAGGTTLWVLNDRTNVLTRVDERAGKPILPPIQLYGSGGNVTLGQGGAWVTLPADHALIRVGTLNHKVSPPIGLGYAPVAEVFSAGSLWVAGPHEITRIDPTDLQKRPIPVSGRILDISTEVALDVPTREIWVLLDTTSS
jgi:hypothetical protein